MSIRVVGGLSWLFTFSLQNPLEDNTHKFESLHNKNRLFASHRITLMERDKPLEQIKVGARDHSMEEITLLTTFWGLLSNSVQN